MGKRDSFVALGKCAAMTMIQTLELLLALSIFNEWSYRGRLIAEPLFIYIQQVVFLKLDLWPKQGHNGSQGQGQNHNTCD